MINIQKSLEKLVLSSTCAKDTVWQLQQYGLTQLQAETQFYKRFMTTYQHYPNESYSTLMNLTCDQYEAQLKYMRKEYNEENNSNTKSNYVYDPDIGIGVFRNRPIR